MQKDPKSRTPFKGEFQKRPYLVYLMKRWPLTLCSPIFEDKKSLAPQIELGKSQKKSMAPPPLPSPLSLAALFFFIFPPSYNV